VKEEGKKQNEKENKKLRGHFSKLLILKDLRIGANRVLRSHDEILFSVFFSCIEKVHWIEKIILVLILQRSVSVYCIVVVIVNNINNI
jgi:hypothetical protein